MGGWSGQRVLVMGLGTKNGGEESARFAVAQGAQVTVTDLAESEYFSAQLAALSKLPLTFRLGRTRRPTSAKRTS
jgi:UDP-N-acetylmuramoylalanine-D-glutamate ligase